MRNHSGHDVNENGNLDKTLKDHGGTGQPERVRDDDFSVAADHETEGGERSPSAQRRGETGDADAVVNADTA